ncbi:hypothetical protein [Saccharopolyspora phatthalungensis]|uniref:Uncharacterized protein n=1 Tax=Saccharopolyspora phatthalungensis TaxID=664693 RepID=A0A840Q0A5_9PSEU|nr:hypothetical protein [Saccharopolyspora phatthalungensis]MBB5153410.1 hypothetical protein [Saccharopolyspora phatthalungensis]
MLLLVARAAIEHQRDRAATVGTPETPTAGRAADGTAGMHRKSPHER